MLGHFRIEFSINFKQRNKAFMLNMSNEFSINSRRMTIFQIEMISSIDYC